jgi:Cellulase (glycosyl hydrolase family 5)
MARALLLWLVLAIVSTGAWGKSRVVAPLTGTVTTGTWSYNQTLAFAAMPGGGGHLYYNVLLPAQYDGSGNTLYPVVVYGHTNDSGMNGSSYPQAGATLITGASISPLSINDVFNTVAYRTAFPAIVLVPECDQTLDLSGENGNANFGGYNDTPDSGGNEQAVNALVQYALANIAGADPTRVYGVGTSLGAIGVLAWLADNNTVNGASPQLWAAGVGMSDQLYRPASVPNSTVIAAMANVPYLAISTPSDNNPASYDQPAWLQDTGNSTYPTPTSYSSGGVAALRASATQYYYMHTTSGVPWTTYLQTNADGGQGTAIWNWLFAQTAGTGVFSVTNAGQIITPTGGTFVARGIDMYAFSLGDAFSTTATSPMTTLFPGINMVRIYDQGYQPASFYAPYVAELTNAGIVVCLLDSFNWTGSDDQSAGGGGGGSGVVFTGSVLTNELNWYASLATAFKNNPYVWFGTDNEPSYNPSLAALSTWQQQTYNAIRGAGNNNPILIDEPAGGNPNTMGPSNGLTASVYAGMTNIIWDLHQYGWLSCPGLMAPCTATVSQDTVNATLAGSPGNGIEGALSMPTNGGGTGGLIIGEYGNSTDGTNIDSNGLEVVTAVTASGYGSTAWAWVPGGTGDVLQTSYVLTAYGTQVAAFIAGGSPTPPTGCTPVSANNAVVTTYGPYLCDAAGNEWAIANTSGGQVTINSATDTTTANVIELAYVSGDIWQENASNLWWYKSSPSAAWLPNYGTSTSPLPPVPPATCGPAQKYMQEVVTDATSPTWNGIITDGGTVTVLAWCDGTNWLAH